MKTKVALCCRETKKQENLLWANDLKHPFLDGAYNRIIDDLPKYLLNGKIVAECDYEVEEIEDRVSFFDSWFNEGHHTKTMSAEELVKKSWVNYVQLTKYLGKGDPNEVLGYAIHIKNLHIFDKPKELSNYGTWVQPLFLNKGELALKRLEKAPKNMMKCYDFEKDYILISIKPQEAYNILNEKQDVLVRRNVLKEMKQWIK